MNNLLNNEQITILVNSCDKYEDAWEPFFKLFNINWPDCPYKVILNTEEKVYPCNFMNVETINYNKKSTWSQRLKHVLENINSEYIIFFLEDFFLQSPVNVDGLKKAVTLMCTDDSVGYIGLKIIMKDIFILSTIPIANSSNLLK